MTEHSAELVVRALKMALFGADQASAWFHTDQGSEYRSYALTKVLGQHGIQASHSPKSSPWRNGSQESFFGRFKVEFGDPERFSSLSELMEAIYCYIGYCSFAEDRPPGIRKFGHLWKSVGTVAVLDFKKI